MQPDCCISTIWRYRYSISDSLIDNLQGSASHTVFMCKLQWHEANIRVGLFCWNIIQREGIWDHKCEYRLLSFVWFFFCLFIYSSDFLQSIIFVSLYLFVISLYIHICRVSVMSTGIVRHNSLYQRSAKLHEQKASSAWWRCWEPSCWVRGQRQPVTFVHWSDRTRLLEMYRDSSLLSYISDCFCLLVIILSKVSKRIP